MINMCDRFNRDNKNTWVRHIKVLDDVEREYEKKKRYKSYCIIICIVIVMTFIWNILVSLLGWY